MLNWLLKSFKSEKLWEPIPKISRIHSLALTILAFFASSLIYLPKFPFDKRFGFAALCSGTVHLFLFIFFQRAKHIHLVIVTYLNIAILGFTIHFTGGITSPFVVIFACIFVATSACKIEHRMILPVVIGTYLAVIGLEYVGLLQPLKISAIDIYQSLPSTLVVVVATVFHLALAGFSYDIILKTLRVNIEHEQAQKQQLLKKMGNLEASSHLGMMVAKIAHDINSPLTAIGGFLQIMQADDSFSKKAREDFEIMFRETKRISAMIDKMLKYIKPGTETKEPICPKDVVETVMTVLQFHPLAKGIQFVKNYQVQDGVLIIGNKQSLQQVYFNIAKNAMEALAGCKGKKIVTVSLTHDAGKCYINVADNGPGMSQETIEKIKEGFFTTKETGTGLGLTVTKEILSGHKGDFDIKSEPEKGTKVLTTLPIHNPISSAIPSPSVESVA